MHRTKGIVPLLFAGVLAIAGLVFAPAPASLGETAPCHVDNVTQGTEGRSIERMAAAAAGGDRVQVRGRCVGGIVVGVDLEIVGAGPDPTLSGGGLGRVVEVLPGATVSIGDLTVRDGVAWAGGGIRNDGTLTLHGVLVRDNRAGRRSPCGRVPDPTCDYRRGSRNKGGGILNTGTLSLQRSRVVDNEAGRGGGIFNRGATLLGVASVSHNFASEWSGAYGGGIFNKGELRVRRSIIARNLVVSGESETAGGGIFNSGTLLVSDSTLSGNRAFGGNGGEGGGIANGSPYGGGCPGDVVITSATIAHNEGRSWSHRDQAGGGIAHAQTECALPGSTIVRASIIASNGRDCAGRFVSDGHNLVGAATRMCRGFSDRVDGDRVGSFARPIDAGLRPLQPNGGLTLTHLLRATSPAIDRAGNAPCATTRDQRYSMRPKGKRCDIGAVEQR